MNIYPPGALIAGRYEVAGRPLLGGIGVVYLWLHRQTQRPVVLKTLRPEYLPDRDTRDRLLREGTTWVSLGRHPHIMRAQGVEYMGDGPDPGSRSLSRSLRPEGLIIAPVGRKRCRIDFPSASQNRSFQFGSSAKPRPRRQPPCRSPSPERGPLADCYT